MFAISGIFSFLSNPILVIGLVLGGAWMWHQADKADAIEEHARQATIVRQAAVSEFVVGMSARNAALAGELATEKGRIKSETVVLQKEVTTYVTPLADSRCIVPAGFVYHHDTAWGLPTIPRPANGLVDQPSGIPLSVVESINTDNAGAGKEWRSEALGWRRWYVDNKAKHNAFAGSPDTRAAAGKPETVQPKERK